MMAAAAAPMSYKSFWKISHPNVPCNKARNQVGAKEDELSLKIAMMTKATISLHPLLRELESHLHSHKNSPAAPCPKTDMSITASYARLGRPLPGAPGT